MVIWGVCGVILVGGGPGGLSDVFFSFLCCRGLTGVPRMLIFFAGLPGVAVCGSGNRRVHERVGGDNGDGVVAVVLSSCWWRWRRRCCFGGASCHAFLVIFRLNLASSRSTKNNERCCHAGLQRPPRVRITIALLVMPV